MREREQKPGIGREAGIIGERKFLELRQGDREEICASEGVLLGYVAADQTTFDGIHLVLAYTY